MYRDSFDFRDEEIGLYSAEAGFGFVTEEHRRGDELLGIAELGVGFDVPYWYCNEKVTRILRDEQGCYVDSGETVQRVDAAADRLIPLCFRADVREPGNYEVELVLYGAGEICVFAGPRRLAFREIAEKEGAVTCSFLLNVCDIIPRGKSDRYERRSIDIAVVGRQVRLSAMNFRPVSCPTLYIAGDSTVTDQTAEYPYAPGTSYAGWGQMIGCYLPRGIAVSNHAHSGLTVESFREEGHYAILRDYIKPGDYLMLQFGHNDQKLMHLQARGGYRDGLAAYVEEARERGAYPIIITPLARNSWKADDGSYNDLLEKYAEACMELGHQYHVPVIDLHGRSMEFVTGKGLENAKAYFYPRDFTHTNDYGAYRMAGFIVRDYLEQVWSGAYRHLAQLMTERSDTWEGEAVLPTVPERYRDVPRPDSDIPLFAGLDRPKEPLTRAEALDMVIKAARFFPINVFNDLFEDIVGHEWYAGTVECAHQNGIILPQMLSGNRLEPEKTVTTEEFLAMVMRGYSSRKKLPKDKPCVFDAVSQLYCIPYVRAACALGVIEDSEDIREIITREHAAEICRALNI
ncbi:MAG: rhamnogalacturonan acetylesterase [Lachnospiraceae bacterium]|nr:rhamnogalacturonan acetylesterase [Lachnospiraceae bacterium]